MKPTINQELLLFTDTAFAKKQIRQDTDGVHGAASAAEQLEKVCWSGRLFRLLPGIFANEEHNMYVWKVDFADEFIHVTAGSAPCSFERETSVHPYFFLKSIYRGN